ncbi:hypothetical protein N7508_008157 [Penicillium antarcticum]|uniref:uncharacterized protein n=1 Tax=Penicillium antarcticum TaxID=416450 RepID=UPI0023A3545B|nr:uncharacterized protein N7508_008157 [Penicillium antarcticum]KAJ5297908.1 hypothetical protein N7508_008157 [Penicillium antarcticum]
MKATFGLGLGALAALCQSVYGLEDGAYTIDSVISGGTEALTDYRQPGVPLEFAQNQRNEYQTWNFQETEKGSSNDKYFLIQSTAGTFLNCGTEKGSACVTSDSPQAFLPEFAGNGKYQLVVEGSGYFLNANYKGQLMLAAYDTTDNELFFLSPAEQ